MQREMILNLWKNANRSINVERIKKTSKELYLKSSWPRWLHCWIALNLQRIVTYIGVTYIDPQHKKKESLPLLYKFSITLTPKHDKKHTSINTYWCKTSVVFRKCNKHFLVRKCFNIIHHVNPKKTDLI